METLKKTLKPVTVFPKMVAIVLIELYQASFSPDHGWFKARHPYGYCKFYPSCSEYSKQSVIKFGLIKGFWLSLQRIVKCNPLSQPKVDPVPNF